LQVADWQGFVPELFRKGQPFVAVAKRSAIRKDLIMLHGVVIFYWISKTQKNKIFY
jgi:hypothetical protein